MPNFRMESIIQQQTNNSGSGYCKMPDGTLIQWGYKDKTVSNVRSWGELYIADFETASFPLTFINDPMLFISPIGSASFMPITAIPSTTGIIALQGSRGSTFQAGINYPYAWLAIGRWK